MILVIMKRFFSSRKIVFPLIFLAAALGLESCGIHLFGDGGGSQAVLESRDTTLGQELMDLQKALDAGIISKSEYDSAKKKLIERYTR